MEASMEVDELSEDEEEHILLDFEDLDGEIDISAGTPYVLTDLDSLNPVLVIGDNIRLIGEYRETVGTCIVFNENEIEGKNPCELRYKKIRRMSLTAPSVSSDELLRYASRNCKEPVVHPETEPSELNLFQEKCIVDDTNTTTKQVKPITSLQRILKFRFAEENAAPSSKSN